MTVPHERLETEDVNKLLLSLSFPAFIAMMASGIYSIIDTVLIGRGVGTIAIGAIAIGFPIQTLYMAFSQLVAIGSAQAISRAIGSQDETKATQIATNAYVLSFFISILLSILTFLFLDPLLTLFGATTDLLPYAKEYIRVISIGVVFNALTLLSNAIFRAQGFTKLSTYSVLIGIFTNLCLSPLLVLGLGWGITGAAVGTVCSHLASCIFSLFFILIKRVGIPLKRSDMKLRLSTIKQIITVGLSAFARNSSTSICSLIINNTLKIYGGSFAILTFGIVNRLVSFFFLPLLGVTQGLQPIVGYNFGANHPQRILKVLRFSIFYTTILGLFATVVSYLFPYQMLSLFTDNQEVVEQAIPILKLKVMLFSLVGIQMVTATFFQSLGKAWSSLFLSLLRQFILLLPLVYFIPRLTDLKLTGVFISFPITDFLSFAITCAMLLYQVRKLRDIKKVATTK